MLYLNYIVYVCFFCFVHECDVRLQNISDVLYAMCCVLMQCLFENKVCNASYIVLSFMYIILGCCLIMCYIFIFEVIMFMGGIHYELFYFFSILFPICIFHHA